MKQLIKLIGLLFVLAGLAILLFPDVVLGWLEENAENRSMYISAIVARLILGVLFITAAKKSSYPVVVKLFGYLLILVAIALVVMGQQRFADFVLVLIPTLNPFAFVAGLVVMVFGGFIIYAFSGKTGSPGRVES